MQLSETTDYKAYIKHRIQENISMRGYQTLLAKAMGCSKSFLSQILAKDIDLTRDQAYRLCQFFHFFAAETDYFLLLVDVARASTPELKDHLQRKIKEAQLSLDGELEKKVSSQSNKKISQLYYSDIHFGLIHMLVLVPEYSTATALAKKLQLAEEKVLFYLQNLQEMGLLQTKASRWYATESENNLERNSKMSLWHHIQWRLQNIQHIRGKDNKALHYSSAFAMSRRDYESIKKLLTETLTECRRQAIASPTSEELFVLCCDLYSY